MVCTTESIEFWALSIVFDFLLLSTCTWHTQLAPTPHKNTKQPQTALKMLAYGIIHVYGRNELSQDSIFTRRLLLCILVDGNHRSMMKQRQRGHMTGIQRIISMKVNEKWMGWDRQRRPKKTMVLVCTFIAASLGTIYHAYGLNHHRSERIQTPKVLNWV